MSELDRLLAEAKNDIDWPDHGALDVEVLARIEPIALRTRPRSARLAVALSVAAVLLALLIVPASRNSLSAWLGVGAVQLEVGSDLPVGSSLELGTETDDLGSVSLTGGLEEYIQAYRDDEDRLWLVYDASGDLPEMSEGIGGLLGIFDGSAGPVIRKQVGDRPDKSRSRRFSAPKRSGWRASRTPSTSSTMAKSSPSEDASREMRWYGKRTATRIDSSPRCLSMRLSHLSLLDRNPLVVSGVSQVHRRCRR